MEAATALHLSEEAQDLILDFVRGCEPAAGARATFHAFCLVSRRWLSSGRRALYYEPLAVYFNSWKQAESLLRSLEDNQALSEAVRSLKTLDMQAVLLNRLKNYATLPEHLHHRAWKWMANVAMACPKLQQLGLNLGDLPQAFLATAALPEHLQTLALSASRTSLTPRDALRQWFDWAATSSLQSVKDLHLHRFNILSQYGPSVQDMHASRFLFDHLSYCHNELPFTRLVALFPFSTSSIRSLFLTTKAAFDQADSTLLQTKFGPHLTVFYFDSTRGASPDGQRLLTSEYGSRGSGHTLPIELFTSLTNLRKLTLRNTKEMTVEKLQALASASPTLVHLNLQHSTWRFSDPLHEGPRIAFIHSKPTLENLLASSFPQLKSINLGVLPATSAGGEWQSLQEVAEKRGVRFKAQICEDPDEWSRCDCGELHRVGEDPHSA